MQDAVEVADVDDAVGDGWGGFADFAAGFVLPFGLSSREVDREQVTRAGADIDNAAGDDGRGLELFAAFPGPEEF